jgi:BirA family biotin operon repressor/biotin-[acetyl-CoA-carboxylase] ligase
VGCAGLAAVDVLTTCCDLPAQLKWPNDVVVGDAKIAGVLAESTGEAVVVGMGLNIDWPTVPEELAGIATAVSLSGGRVQPRVLVLHEWLRRFEHWSRVLETPGTGERLLRIAQRARSATLGRTVRIDLVDESFTGTAVALAPDGHLVVRTDDGVERTVTTGDVVHARRT